MFEVIGHRGAGSLLPENTLDSFKLAYELGCPRIELDIHLTSDLQAAVIHNPTLEPTTNGKGFVSDYTMEELKCYDAGEGKKIPDLREVLAVFTATDLLFQIELKGPGSEAIVPDIVAAFGFAHRVRYTSFFHERVQKAVAFSGSSGGLLMCASPIDPVDLLISAGVDYLHLNRYNISIDIVERLHYYGKKIIAWDNIVEESTFKLLTEMNVDGATTDRPDLFLKFLNSQTPVR